MLPPTSGEEIGERRISEGDFDAALPALLRWGVKPDHDGFGSVDEDGNGEVLFDELADWAMWNRDDPSGGEEPEPSRPSSSVSGSVLSSAPGSRKKKAAASGVKAGHASKLQSHVNQDESRIDFDWADFASKLPVGRDAASKEIRARAFRVCDTNGNGVLSLAEFDRGLLEVRGAARARATPAVRPPLCGRHPNAHIGRPLTLRRPCGAAPPLCTILPLRRPFPRHALPLRPPPPPASWARPHPANGCARARTDPV
eukprot:6947282-Prymnesium_polylepis.1